MADTPLAPFVKTTPPYPARRFVIAAIRRHCAALLNIPEAELPAEYAVAFADVEVHVSPETWIVTTIPGGSING